MEIVKISTEYIKLDQFLKFAGITENGSDAKYLVVNGYVDVNGQKEIRRGRKLYKDDTVHIDYEGQCFDLRVEYL